MIKKKQWIILICIILMIIGLCIGGYFWYKYRYNGCFKFYETHECGFAEDECTFKRVLFGNNWCD